MIRINMEEYGIKIIYGFFTATVLLALATALYQWLQERKRIYLLSIFYWASCLTSTIINVFVENVHSFFYIISAFTTYVSVSILAMVICETRGLKYKHKLANYFFVFGYIVAEIFRYLDCSFTFYITLCLVVSIFPVPHSLWLVYKSKRNKITSAQKLFYCFSAILAIHYLDYGFFKIHPELFTYASAIAFLLLHILSTLMPMVVNEYALLVRNNNLENEVQQRLEELRNKDLQLWESTKLEVLGRFSGLLAHELNTPICAVGIASSSIKRSLQEPVINKDKISNKIDKIKSILNQIIAITTTLRAASGDLKKGNLTNLDMNQFLLEEEENTKVFCSNQNINYQLTLPPTPQKILGNRIELSQAIRTLILNSIKHMNFQEENAWIKIELLTAGDNCLLKYSDSRAKEKVQNNIFSNDLDLLVIKSIVENHHAKMEFDFNKTQQTVLLKFPLKSET